MKQSNDFHQEIIVSSAEWGDHSKLLGRCPLHILGLFSVLNILLILQILNLYPSFKSIECQFFCLFVYSITFLGLLNLLSWNRQGRFPLVMVLGYVPDHAKQTFAWKATICFLFYHIVNYYFLFSYQYVFTTYTWLLWLDMTAFEAFSFLLLLAASATGVSGCWKGLYSSNCLKLK